MKIKLTKASSWTWEEEREIETLEELLALSKEFKAALIVSPETDSVEITIYDGYVE